MHTRLKDRQDSLPVILSWALGQVGHKPVLLEPRLESVEGSWMGLNLCVHSGPPEGQNTLIY